MKQYLGHKLSQVAKCNNVPPPVKKEVQGLLDAGKKKIIQELRRHPEYEACIEEIFGPMKEEELSFDDDDDDYESGIHATRRESEVPSR